MNYVTIEYLRYFIFISVVIYFIFDYFDRRKINDEREEFLRLKTFELVQKTTLFTISLLSIAYLLYPQMPAWVPLILIVVSSLYTEIFGKYFLRWRH